MRTLYQSLLDADPVRLSAIARSWDTELTSDSRQKAASELATVMDAPDAASTVWEALPGDQRQALVALLASGGRMPMRVLIREWGDIRAMGPGRMERVHPWLDPVSPAEGLWYRGIISRAFGQSADGTYEIAYVPPELQVHFSVPSDLRSAIDLEPSTAPGEVLPTGDKLLDDVCTVLAYVQNDDVRQLANGGWPERHLARLARLLHDADQGRFSFLCHLSRRAGLLHIPESGLLRPDPSHATTWLQSPTEQQRASLVEAWGKDTTWNDLGHVPSLRHEETGAWRNDPVRARQAILRHLAACKGAAWYGLDGFVAAIKRADPDFQRPDGDYTSWYIRDSEGGVYLSGFESWDAVEGSLICYLITGPLNWLGLVDVGWTGPGRAHTAFRLAPAALTSLGLAGSSAEPEAAPLTMRNGPTVLVPAARRYERFQLARVADWVRTSDPYAYRLTSTSLERAREQGISVSRVLGYLSRVISAPVPRCVEAALTRWEARGPEVRLERVLLLRLASEELMAQVAASPSTRHLIREQVGAAAAIVLERDWLQIADALGEMGLLPDVIPG